MPGNAIHTTAVDNNFREIFTTGNTGTPRRVNSPFRILGSKIDFQIFAIRVFRSTGARHPENKMKTLRIFFLFTDIGFVLYWLITLMGLIPASYLFKDYVTGLSSRSIF